MSIHLSQETGSTIPQGLLFISRRCTHAAMSKGNHGYSFTSRESVNSHTSLLTRQNAKAIWCPHFYSQFCYKFAHFSEDGLFLFPEHSITVTSGTENHFDKCLIYREMNSHKGDQFFFLFLSFFYWRRKLLNKIYFSLN